MLNGQHQKYSSEGGLELTHSSKHSENNNNNSNINNNIPPRVHNDDNDNDDDDRYEGFEDKIDAIRNRNGMISSSNNDDQETDATNNTGGSGHWKILVAGQVLSFGIFASGAVNSSLSLDCNLTAPTFQSIFLYFLLSLHLLPCCRNFKIRFQLGAETRDTPRYTGEVRIPNSYDDEDTLTNDDNDNDESSLQSSCSETNNNITHYYLCGKYIQLHAPAWVYFIRAVLDVEANFFTFLGYRYTTFSSATLFDSLAIPSSMLCSRLFIGRKYRKVHFIGATICMIGIFLNVMTDYRQDQNDDVKTSYPKKTLGDLYTIIGGILFGLNDVLSEIAVKNFGGVHEYLGMIGIFGFIISVIQSMAIESDEIQKYFQSPSYIQQGQTNDDDDEKVCTLMTGWLLMMLYATFMYLSYVGGAFFLKVSEAALFNLSLLTADFWSVIFTIVVQHILPKSTFWVALFFIVSGVSMYETAPSPLSDTEESFSPESNKVIKFFSTYFSWMRLRNNNEYAYNNKCDSKFNEDLDDDDVWVAYDDDFVSHKSAFTIT